MNITTLFLIFTALVHSVVSSRKDYTGYRYYILDPTTEVQKQYLMKLEYDWTGFSIKPDFFVRVNEIGRKVQLMVAPGDVTHFEAKLTENGIAIQKASENVQANIDNENILPAPFKTDSCDFPYQLANGSSRTYPLTLYNRYQDISNFIQGLARKESAFMEASSIGQTAEGREIQYLRISKDDSLEEGTCKPAILIEGGIHAREFISTAILAHVAAKFSSTDHADANDLLDKLTFHLIPVVNPDGYEYAFTEDRFWRKNRRSLMEASCNGVEQMESTEDSAVRQARFANYCNGTTANYIPAPESSTKCCVGANLNSNFDYNWHIRTPTPVPADTINDEAKMAICMEEIAFYDQAVHDKCDVSYMGTAPFSEPEARAIRDKVQALHGRACIKAFIDIHSFGNVVYYPFGDRNEYAGKEKVAALAKKAGDAMRAVNEQQFFVVSAYIFSGGLLGGLVTDWAAANESIPYAIGIESRPPYNISIPLNLGFILPCAEIPDATAEAWAGIKAIAQHVIDEFVDSK